MILIIGAGWYGCHIASILLEKNIPFVIYEAASDIFSGSSFFNQNRLHLGFHYPRSYKTRKLCVDGYSKFLNKYSFVTQNIERNAYYISLDSLMDYETYIGIFNHENIAFKTEKIELEKNVEINKILVEEKFIDPEKIKNYFSELLADKIIFNRKVEVLELEKLKSEFSYVFNCTMGRLVYNFKNSYIYEKTLSLLYRQKEEQSESYTIMDGKFSSLYPQNLTNKIYSLTDVEHTPLVSSDFPIKDFDFNLLKKISLFENKFMSFIPNFKDNYEYSGYFVSDKIKPKLKNDSRELIVENENNVFSFICGKITGIFEAEEYLSIILNHNIPNKNHKCN